MVEEKWFRLTFQFDSLTGTRTPAEIGWKVEMIIAIPRKDKFINMIEVEVDVLFF